MCSENAPPHDEAASSCIHQYVYNVPLRRCIMTLERAFWPGVYYVPRFEFMAHQAHAIPWSNFSSHFAITSIPHIGPKTELYALDKPNQGRDLAHFSRVFTTQIQQFAKSERAKYSTADELKKRASHWNHSTHEVDPDGHDLSSTEEQTRRSKKWQSAKDKKANEIRSKGPEDRKVYTDALRKKYSPVYQYQSEWGKLEPPTQYIENWWNYVRPEPYTDALKILVMEACVATHPISNRVEQSATQKECAETVLLLLNHPSIPGYILRNNGGGATYNGLWAMTDKALQAYLYFNLLYCLKESGFDAFEPVTEEDEDCIPAGLFCYQLSGKVGTRTLKRYMNTSGWYSIMSFLVGSNWYNSEQIMHRPYFFPKWNSGEEELVLDPLDDVKGLREYLKGLWRILVFYEMIWREMDELVKWEDRILDAVAAFAKRVRFVYDSTGKRSFE